MCLGVTQNLERHGLKGVAHKYSRRFVPLPVDRRLPAAQIVVVHAGQIIVDKAIGMDAFDRGCRPTGLLGWNVKQASPFEDQEPTQSFAPTRGIPHALCNRIVPKRAKHVVQGCLNIIRPRR